MFVYGKGEEYRFYIAPGSYSTCISYIGPDGVVQDFAEGVEATEISDLGYFCTLSMMELHWAGLR